MVSEINSLNSESEIASLFSPLLASFSLLTH